LKEFCALQLYNCYLFLFRFIKRPFISIHFCDCLNIIEVYVIHKKENLLHNEWHSNELYALLDLNFKWEDTLLTTYLRLFSNMIQPLFYNLIAKYLWDILHTYEYYLIPDLNHIKAKIFYSTFILQIVILLWIWFLEFFFHIAIIIENKRKIASNNMQSNNGNVKSNTVKRKYLQCFTPYCIIVTIKLFNLFFVKLDANFIIFSRK